MQRAESKCYPDEHYVPSVVTYLVPTPPLKGGWDTLGGTMRKFGPSPSLTRHSPISISKEGKSPEGAATGGVAGALSGAATGAALGTTFPVIGNLAGAIGGAIIGGAAGGMKGYKSGPKAEHLKEAAEGAMSLAAARKKAAKAKTKKDPAKGYTRAQIKEDYEKAKATLPPRRA